MSAKTPIVPPPARLPDTPFKIWQHANAVRTRRTEIDEKVIHESDKLAVRHMEDQMTFLLKYSIALDVVASFKPAVDLKDALAHLAIAHGEIEALHGNEPCDDDKETVERVFRLVSSALVAVADACGLDLGKVTGERELQKRIAERFVEVPV